jgi:hypothetical protein
MKFKTYLFSYRFQGDSWCFEIKAASPEEAKERLSALVFAKYDGEVKAKIHVPTGFLPRLKSLFR